MGNGLEQFVRVLLQSLIRAAAIAPYPNVQYWYNKDMSIKIPKGFRHFVM